MGLVLFIPTSFIYTKAQDTGIQVGDTAPIFSGIDQFDSLISSEMVLDSSDNYVIIFYRGSWCKYCRKHLSALSDSLELILAQNTSVIELRRKHQNLGSEWNQRLDLNFQLFQTQVIIL